MSKKKKIVKIFYILLVIVFPIFLYVILNPDTNNQNKLLLIIAGWGCLLLLLIEFCHQWISRSKEPDKLFSRVGKSLKRMLIFLYQLVIIISLVSMFVFIYDKLVNLVFPSPDPRFLLRNNLPAQILILLSLVTLLIVCFTGFVKMRKIKSQKPFSEKLVELIHGILMSCLTIIFLVFTIEYSARCYLANNDYAFNGRYIPFPNIFGLQKDIIYSDQQYHEIAPLAMLLDMESFEFPQPDNIRGKYYNVVNHVRVTTNQPAVYSQTIYMFGGSTMYCAEGADWMTLSSNLQREINMIFPNKYQVINLGVMGHSTWGQYHRLITTTLEPGDIVIFYDGSNDVWGAFSGTFYKRGVTDEIVKSDPWFHQLTTSINEKSAFFDLFLAPYNFPPRIVRDIEMQKFALDNLLKDYSKHLIKSRNFTEQSGAIFFHFLQPNLFTLSELSPYEHTLFNYYPLSPRGYADVNRLAYQALIAYNQVLIENGITSFDITDALNSEFRQPGQEVFLDYVHVNHEGNALLAKRIFAELQPYLAE